MYIFGEAFPSWAITDFFGFEYTGKGTGWNERVLIFIKDDRVVYEERRHRRKDYMVYFYHRNQSMSSFQRPFYNVPYLIERVKRDNGKYGYQLSPLEPPAESPSTE